MDQEKRNTIVREIEQWRRSRLLPEHYCDFLLNLYMDDRDEREKRAWFGLSARAVQNSGWTRWLLGFGGLAVLALILLNFNSFPNSLQIAICALFSVVLLMAGFVERRRNPLLAYVLFGAGSVVLLLGGLYILYRMAAPDLVTVVFLALCSMIWVLTGIMARLPVFHFCGWLVLILIYAGLLRQNITSFDWMGLQMAWLPVCLALVWLGWLFHHRNKPIGAVLLIVGFFVWFVPEIYGMAQTDIPFEGLQLSLLAKLAIAAGTLFALRKKWTEWIA